MKRRRGVGAAMSSSFGTDGQKYDEMIQAGWLCLLLWQISILGGAFEQEGSREAGTGRDLSICARKLKIHEGDKSDGCSKKAFL